MQYNLVVLWFSGVRGLQNVLQMAIYPWSHSRLMNASFADLHWWWFVWRCRISSFKYALIEQNYFWKHCICLDKGSLVFALCKVSWYNCKWRNSRPARQPEPLEAAGTSPLSWGWVCRPIHPNLAAPNTTPAPLLSLCKGLKSRTSWVLH